MISRFSPYDLVAAEYYDPIAHPTCANFRELSRNFLGDLRSNNRFEEILIGGKVIETGAGSSLIAETLSLENILIGDLTIQDASEKMLENSIRWQNSIGRMYVSDARQLPEKEKAFDMAFSFLADPYNDAGLWNEIDRVLKHSGLWIVTLPSHRWASSFRSKRERNVSRFVLRDGAEADLPSVTYPISKLISNVERRNLYLRKFTSFTTRHLAEPISPKLNVIGSAASVLDCFVFEKIEDR